MDCQRSNVEYFLATLSVEDKLQLFNDLLAVDEVYHLNKDTSFYTFRKLKRASQRHCECRKRTIQFKNQKNDELVIHQIHEQHIFKNHYRFQVFYNLEEQNFSFIELLLEALREERVSQYTHQRVALA
ncbi:MULTISPECIES: hypothetical protein [Enterococcus]|uniref:hypothetical protein n=1 Tax=Enterococcus TaxID=1350 RepID=UPI00065E9496|nr:MULTISPECIES: hypothetical protein [Enterococcus]KAF1304741.1 hypothetical protein BAU16_00785 [Enterococcus sp. JM9B]